MYRKLFLVLFYYFLLSPPIYSQTLSPYKSYEGTKWSGKNGENIRFSIFIDEITGSKFKGELHREIDLISVIEGHFLGNDSINFIEKEIILGRLPLKSIYPGTIKNDTINGIWIHPTHPASGRTYFLAKYHKYQQREKDYEIITSYYRLNTELNTSIDSMLNIKES